jgi:hypothetical protein
MCMSFLWNILHSRQLVLHTHGLQRAQMVMYVELSDVAHWFHLHHAHES